MKPRVLIAAPFPPPTTGQSLVTEMAAEALGEGAEVVRLDTADRTLVWRRSWSVPSRRVARWRANLSRLRTTLRETPVDAVYLTPASSALGFLRDVLMVSIIPRPIPILAHIHAGDYGRLLGAGVLGPLARAVARRFHTLIVPSAYAAAPIRRALPEADLRVVHNTVREGLRFAPADVDAAWDRREGRPVVLFLSNMIPSKGYSLLAEAVPLLGRDVELVFAGAWASGDDRAAFERTLQTLDLDARVLGAVGEAETRALFASASVFAFPSTYPHESFPLAVLEAKAAGCAVVAIDHAGVGEMVRDGVDGRLVARADARAFAAALGEALDDAERLGRAGAAHVREAFAPDAFGGALADVIHDLSFDSRPALP
ncbi:MAG: glycosyltransferase family 4 protein [Bacteroidota bacterium]